MCAYNPKQTLSLCHFLHLFLPGLFKCSTFCPLCVCPRVCISFRLTVSVMCDYVLLVCAYCMSSFVLLFVCMHKNMFIHADTQHHKIILCGPCSDLIMDNFLLIKACSLSLSHAHAHSFSLRLNPFFCGFFCTHFQTRHHFILCSLKTHSTILFSFCFSYFHSSVFMCFWYMFISSNYATISLDTYNYVCKKVY